MEALSAALGAMRSRHESLRTTFEERDGTGLQIIHDDTAKDYELVATPSTSDTNHLSLLHEAQTTAFDLTATPPWRVSLFQLGEGDYVLSIVMHHIISDGWSLDVFTRELGIFYSAALRGEKPPIYSLPIQYRDFAAWQKEDEQVDEHQRQLAYWTRELTDSAPAELFCDKSRPALLSGQAEIVEVVIDEALHGRLRAYCRLAQVTPFVVLLSAFRAVHYRLTGAEDATIGVPIANRNRPELDNLIGVFVNTQCMRVAIKDDQSFDQVVQQVRLTGAAAQENQDVPFERVVSALLPGSRDTSRNPLVQLLFAVHSQQNLGKIQLEGITADSLPLPTTTRFDLEFHVYEQPGRFHAHILFSTDLFHRHTIDNMAGIFREILDRGLELPRMPVSLLPLANGLQGLLGNDPMAENIGYPRGSSIVDVFRSEAARSASAIAVRDTTTQLTYAELDRESDKLAVWLRCRGLPAESLIAVLAPRSCQAIVALIGILKARLAYLPLDVNAPTGRLEKVISQVSGQKLVLLGTGVPTPAMNLDDAELVRIDAALALLLPTSVNMGGGPT